ncbi:MAG: flavin reductase family protein [Planctomycetota bacterium]|jgi:flavin reductase (DIM6/NTAB) family NADH-FMN oxidoreductase RutF
MSKTQIKPVRPIYPSPAALITSVDSAGTPNIITLAEVFNISIVDPVIVGIAIRPATYSHGLIVASGEFVVNQPTAALVKQVDQCGSISGRDDVDKFERFGLTAMPAVVVAPPLIAECPVNVECKVIGTQTVGDHDLFLGEAMAVHVDDDKLNADGVIATGRLHPLAYMQGEYWSLGERIAGHGFSGGE